MDEAKNALGSPTPLSRPATLRPATLATLALAALGCLLPSPRPTYGAESESWLCRNTVEIRCVDGACKATEADGFTPMNVSADSSGFLEVCAYSGCWQGDATVTRSESAFIVLIGRDLPFSTAPEPGESSADVALTIDLRDNVAILKVGEFAHPLLCKRG